MWNRVVLIGFSGTGKSTVARLLGEKIGWSVVDLDEDLELHFGMTIPEVFAGAGETVFRRAERQALENACRLERVIIATGGGAAADESAWSDELLGNASTLTIALDVAPEVSLKRLQEQQLSEGDAVRRPMIEGDDPLSRISALKAKRQQSYDKARLTMPVDEVDPVGVAGEIASFIDPSPSYESPSVTLKAPGGLSRIFVHAGLIERSGELIHQAFPNARRAWIITDANVAGFHADRISSNLKNAGFAASVVVVPPGESSKSIQGISQVYDAMLGGGVERGDIVVALGGGVVGDLAGFAAATVLRGIGLVQIPTSLLAMVDSSVGGKTGINHPAGKNLIGSFYQPPLVLIDPELLRTLPQRELDQGWAEVIKHGVIQRSIPGDERGDLTTFLERNSQPLRSLQEPATSYLIMRNVALKARVVEADERETGIRAYLNFGHTLGHAIEASDYSLLHGEAVALGMRAAATLSMNANDAAEQDVEMLQVLLDTFNLPRTCSIDVDRALDLMRSDKKRVAGEQRWILMKSQGGVEIRTGVPTDAVSAALRTIVIPANR